MRVSSIQMDMRLGDPKYNFHHAEELIRNAVKCENPDVVVLPETWNIGFFPKEGLKELCDNDGVHTKAVMGGLAKELAVNIVAGSVGNCRDGKIYNTSYTFDRKGNCVNQYDKIHLFTPMGEHNYFAYGEKYAPFQLDGVSCGLIICYDVRFPELTRSLTLQGVDVFFVVSQWPAIRVPHIDVLTRARAIENQMFLALCNSCGRAGDTVYGGSSALIDPWGELLAQAKNAEETITANFDLSIVKGIRESINVFRDRKPNLYKIH